MWNIETKGIDAFNIILRFGIYAFIRSDLSEHYSVYLKAIYLMQILPIQWKSDVRNWGQNYVNSNKKSFQFIYD